MSREISKEHTTIHTKINDHEVVFHFTDEYNGNLPSLVKNALIDSFISNQPALLGLKK